MKLINEIKEFFQDFKQIKIDRENRKKFIEEIKQEIKNPASNYNRLKLNINEKFDTLSCLFTLPDDIQFNGSDAEKFAILNQMARQVNLYIGQDINWGEYFTSPEFFYIEDPDDVEKPSVTYLATWKYVPVLASPVYNFKKKLITFLSINTTILIGIILLIILI